MLPFRYYGGSVIIAPKSEGRYFEHYRAEHPEETFNVVDYAETLRFFSYVYDEKKAISCLEELGLSKEKAKEVLPYLCRMTKDRYKCGELYALGRLKDELIQRGIFQKEGDSTAFFCGKTIIIRGYYSGLFISEALQDLPNISLNWDLGRPELREQELARTECPFLEQALALAKKQVEQLIQDGTETKDIYFRSDIPGVSLDGVTCLEGPYAPSDGKVIYLESKRDCVRQNDLFSPVALAELHLVPFATKQSRDEADERCFLRHPSLVSRLYVFPRD